MRMLLLPKSIEEQFIKKVNQSRYYEFAKDLLVLMEDILVCRRLPPKVLRTGAHDCHLVLAVCRDGDAWGDAGTYAQRVAHNLQQLCALMGLRAEISFRIFSFTDDEDRMMATLKGCDIFYMGGIHSISEKWARDSEQSPARRLSEEIQRRVQYNMMAYIGICGGAKISGSVSYYGLAPLDLLQGAEVLYDINCSRAQVCTTQNAVQITTGCAVAIYMWQNRRQGICFPVVKNAGQWWPFAEQNTMALQDFVVQKWNTPEELIFAEGNWQLNWYFSLGGYCKYIKDEEWTAIQSDEEWTGVLL